MTTTEAPFRYLLASQLCVGDIVTHVGGEPVRPRMVMREFGDLPDTGGAQGIELDGFGGPRCIIYRADVERMNVGDSTFTVVRRSRGYADPAKAAALAGRQAGWDPNAGGGHIYRPRTTVGPRTDTVGTRVEEDRRGAQTVYTGFHGWRDAVKWMVPRGWIVEVDGRWYATARGRGWTRPVAPAQPVQISRRIGAARPAVLTAEGWRKLGHRDQAAGCGSRGCDNPGIYDHPSITVGECRPLCVGHAHRVQVYGLDRARSLRLIDNG